MNVDDPGSCVDGCLGFLTGANQNGQNNALVGGEMRAGTANIDALIAQELNRLSVQEREQALEDVHGVSGMEEEDKERMRRCLETLEERLNFLKDESDAYAIAEKMSKDYVTNYNFRMMFLRADRYNAEDAANRLMLFFEEKRRLFGVEKLVKDITLEDLSPDDMDVLKSGYIQVSPEPDVAGRPILGFYFKFRNYKTPENSVRTKSRIVSEFESSRRWCTPFLTVVPLLPMP